MQDFVIYYAHASRAIKTMAQGVKDAAQGFS